MKDKGREETDRKLKELEKQLAEIYSQANKELVQKMEKYFKDFKRKDEAKRQAVEKGEITDEEYKRWRTGQLAAGNRWIAMCDTIAADMNNVNNIARSITQGYMPEVYAINHNWGTYSVEHGAKINTNYTMYNAQVVEKLMQDDPDIMPLASEGIHSEKDKAWNRKVINAVMLQGILQGESINEMAKRFESVGVSNYKSSVRYARTSITGAENAGRIDSYKRAQELGIKLKKIWIATLDGRTRDSHRDMDGEEQEVDDTFSNGCEHPGDPSGPPSEVWNCRCTLITKVVNQQIDVSDLTQRYNKLGSMTYEEWKNEHKAAKPVKSEEEISFTPAQNIREAEKFAVDNGLAVNVNYGRMDLDRANTVNRALVRLKQKYPTETLDNLKYNSRLKTANAKANFSRIEIGPPHSDNGYWENREKYLAEYLELIDKYSDDRYKGIKEARAYVKKLEKAVEALREELKYDRWSVSSVYGLDSTVTHEYGHVLSDQYFGQINGHSANKNYYTEPVREQNEYLHGVFSKAKGNGDIYKISAYAATDEGEFFAETFAMYDKGEKLPDYIKEFIEEVLKDGAL